MEGRHVLILGAMRQCHDRLMTTGARISLLIGKSRALTKDLAGTYRHILIHDDELDDASIRLMAMGLHLADPFDFVISFVDRTQVLANSIATKLGLPVVIESELVELTRNKLATRRRLQAHSLRSCRFGVASTAREFEQAVEAVGLPCIVKPVAGEGSRNVRKLRDAAELVAYAAEQDDSARDEAVLVEQFLEGDEYSVEAISVAGQHHFVAVTRKYKDLGNFVELGHAVPAPLEDGSRQAILRYVAEVLTALGFHDGPSHTEVIATAEGPCLVETHTRLGGDRIADLVELVTGIDLYNVYARQMVQLPMLRMANRSRRAEAAAVWYLHEPSLERQVVVEVRGVEEARRCPDVHQVGMLKNPGERGGDVNASADRSAFVVATGPDVDHAVAAARHAAARIQLLYRFDCGD
ncbi:ATP-grasp domain-containing protein [Paraburkholderia aspalathi]|uniref:ATP-grasp domain-containing protein n=1 Tax=Paraburkholderia aspalathi TaxID=1324617 RepID=UPI0038BCB2D6